MAIHVIDKVGQLAASGTANVTIPVAQMREALVLSVGAGYATNDATGVSVAISTSVDGSAFTAAGETMANVNPAANVTGQNTTVVRLGNDPFRLEAPAFLNAVKVSITNTSATTPANYVISHQLEKANP